MILSFWPHPVKIISLRGNGFSSGDWLQITEQVAHWKHFLTVSPPAVFTSRMKSRSGSTKRLPAIRTLLSITEPHRVSIRHLIKPVTKIDAPDNSVKYFC
jgi:hypothetical protein